MFLGALIAFVLAPAALDRIEIPIKNVAASYVLQKLAVDKTADLSAGIVVPHLDEKVRFFADDAKNVIIAEGPRDSLGILNNIIRIFDVAPMRVVLRIRYRIPTFNLVSDAVVSVANNSDVTLREESALFQTSVTPRINEGDNTITLLCTVKRGPRKADLIARIKLGESVYWVNGRVYGAKIVQEPGIDDLRTEGVDQKPELDLGTVLWVTPERIEERAK